MTRIPKVGLTLRLPLLALAALLGVAAPAPAKTHNSKDALWRTERLAEMIDAYRQALPGKLRVLNFEISYDRAELQVQDPAKPKHVDEYDYLHEQVSRPAPVKLYGSGSLEDSLYDWDEVAWDRIPAVVSKAVKMVKLEHGKVSGVTVKRDLPSTKDVRIFVHLYGPRQTGGLTADAQGNVLEAKVY
jgi:hypothetical protein